VSSFSGASLFGNAPRGYCPRSGVADGEGGVSISVLLTPVRCMSRAGSNKSGYTSSVPTKPFTHKQGQYLAFIYYYGKVNGRPPAEVDMQRYFQVSPPSIHQMVLALEANGFIERVPG
jgi:hypothetical protein